MNASPAASPARSVCVYCASSRSAHPDYREAARRLGRVLAQGGVTVVYGGGAVGSMGALADGVLAAGGRIIGVLPQFMAELEWGHPGLTELQLVEDLRTRKHAMLTMSQAAIALPGGSGTLEELLEAITLKRLGLYLNPIVLINTRGFFHAPRAAVAARRRRALHGSAPPEDVAARCRHARGSPGRARARTALDPGCARLRRRLTPHLAARTLPRSARATAVQELSGGPAR